MHRIIRQGQGANLILDLLIPNRITGVAEPLDLTTVTSMVFTLDGPHHTISNLAYAIRSTNVCISDSKFSSLPPATYSLSGTIFSGLYTYNFVVQSALTVDRTVKASGTTFYLPSITAQPVIERDSTSVTADEEDLTLLSNGEMRLKDRTSGTNKKGYKILRSGLSFATQVTNTDTIYEVRDAFTLSSNFTMPSNCELRFLGGSINGSATLTLGNTYCTGVDAIHCPVKSSIPVKTSLCGIGNAWSNDSSARFTSLVSNEVKVVVDSSITCLSPVYSNGKGFRIEGEHGSGFNSGSLNYTINFPNSDGFVLNSGTGSESTGITFGSRFSNLRIISNGTCINFWPADHVAVFAENIYENLFLQSDNGNCLDFGANFGYYYTAGFNQYVRNVEARAYNGVCFNNVHANTMIWDHITIYGSLNGGFRNCNGTYTGVIFDQASAGHTNYGWVWSESPDSLAVITMNHCHFEKLKCPIAADTSFNGHFVINDMYSDCNNDYDDPNDGLKHFDRFNFGNARSISIRGMYNYTTGGAFATGFAQYKNFSSTFNNYGSTIDVLVGNLMVRCQGLADGSATSYYSQLEFSNSMRTIPISGAGRIKRLECESFKQLFISESDIAINQNNVITSTACKSLSLSTTRTINGFGGYQPGWFNGTEGLYEFDILNNSTDSNLTLIHRSSQPSATTIFNSFTGSSVVLGPKQIAHCVYNAFQQVGDVVENKRAIQITHISTFDTNYGSSRPSNPTPGQQFFDSALSKPVWWTGTKWVDSTGADV